MGPPSSSSLAPGTRGTQGRPQRHVYTGTGGRNSPRDATLAERRASTGRGEDPLCRHTDSKARGARGGPDTSRQTGLSDYLGNPSRKSTASATRGRGRQSSVETIGDAYMAVTGVPEFQEDHAERMADFAMDMLEEAGNVPSPASGLPLQGLQT
ncbi:hypothetical protein ACOMHN_055608 [Nucella lapillus]